jgi:hypothetical protein
MWSELLAIAAPKTRNSNLDTAPPPPTVNHRPGSATITVAWKSFHSKIDENRSVFMKTDRPYLEFLKKWRNLK